VTITILPHKPLFVKDFQSPLRMGFVLHSYLCLAVWSTLQMERGNIEYSDAG